MKYRAEIDGLRALAVVPVILFHAGLGVPSGGFLGVDVFFVISGYLITGIILDELERGQFSIAGFYERRARRILPALFVVMLCSIPLAWLWMFPSQFRDFGQSLSAVGAFVSNFLFWHESGYFSGPSDTKPLLHTWSLAVEEQFYVVFPLFLAVIWRMGRRQAATVIVVAALVSLLLSEVAVRIAPDANFYLAPFRAWELMAGSLCAFYTGRWGVRSSGVLSLFGMALVVVSMLLFTESTPSPSLLTVIPVAGSALLLICATRETLVGQFLASRVLVGIGLISYSAYLWHQPVFAFARVSTTQPPGILSMFFLAALSIILAYLTWRFVETPFRKTGPARLLGRKSILLAAAIGSCAFVVLGTAADRYVSPYIAMSRPELFQPDIERLSDAALCEGFGPHKSATCSRFGDGKDVIVVWGDSHAIALEKGIVPIAGKSIYVVSHWGCPPIINVKRADRIGNAENCDDVNVLRAYADFIVRLKPQAIVLVGRWTLYLRGWQREGVLQAATHFLADEKTAVPDIQTSREVFEKHMQETVRFLSATAPVFVVTQVPDLNMFSERERLLLDDLPSDEILGWHDVEVAAFHTVARASSFQLVDPRSLFCSEKSCRVRMNGRRLYTDDNHLSQAGAEMVWRRILEEISSRVQR